MPLHNSGVAQVTSANADIAVANGTTAPVLTLNSGTGNNQIVKLDSSARLPAVDGSQLTNLASAPDLSYLNEQQLIQQIDILRCLAENSLAISDYNTLFCDVFSDSNGYSNTIDTGETDAIFSTNKYVNGESGSDVVDPSGQTLGSSSTVDYWGCKIEANNDCVLKSITKHSSSTPNDVALCTMNVGEDHCTIVDTASFSGDVATFSSPPALTAGTRYYLLFGSTGISFTRRYNTLSFPISGTNVDYVSGAYSNAAMDLYDVADTLINVVSITTGVTNPPANKIVQTNTIPVSDDLTAFQLYCKNAVAGSGSVQYKISFDDGSSWSSAKELNTKYTNATTGTDVKIQLLLNGVGSGNTAEAENYSLMVWY